MLFINTYDTYHRPYQQPGHWSAHPKPILEYNTKI